MLLRGVVDGVDHPLTNPVRDFAWEEFTKSLNAPYGVPRFETREAALEAYHNIPSSSAIDCVDTWECLEKVILPVLTAPSYSFGLPEKDVSIPVTEEYFETVLTGTVAKLELPVHNSRLPRDVAGTLRFLYEYMRAGIVVRIVHGKVVCFCPFYNPDFRNAWPEQFPRGAEKFRTGLPKERWWANGGILCTEMFPWGTHFVMQIKDMIAEAADTFGIADAIFCVNKRDFPQFKYNDRLCTLVEPYGFLFDRDDRDSFQDVPLAMSPPQVVLPMLSFYGTHTSRFSDLLIPPTEDWEASARIVYMPGMCMRGALQLSSVRDLTRVVPVRPSEFASKKDRLFFRGTATGSGTTEMTNQRMRAFRLAQRLADARIDIRCVALSKRIHKHFAESVATIDAVSFPVSQTFYVPMSDQIHHKFLLYLEGHCAACRLGSMLGSGCVVFKADSTCVASELWFTHLLRENVHYVRIRADLTDLVDKVAHYIAHSAEAEQIARNARVFYETYLSRPNLVNYVGSVLLATTV
jgi:hypothetical protein